MSLELKLVKTTVNSATVQWTSSGSTPDSTSAAFKVTLSSNDGKNQTSVIVHQSGQTDVRLQGVCSHSFHFLPPAWPFRITVSANKDTSDQSQQDAVVAGRTAPPIAPINMDWRVYVGQEHDVGSWVSEAPGDWMWALEPKCSYELLRDIWRSGMFALFQRGLVLCPNPEKRFCLRIGPEESCWSHSKKLRRHSKDFRLALNTDFAHTLSACQKYHVKEHKSTWITPGLISMLDRLRQDPEAGLEVCCFELWEGDNLVAATFSFLRGKVFHDFTMCTLLRDHRSIGNILSKAVGHLLGILGKHTCWYWGFKTAYMADYDSYGAHDLDRAEFQGLWDADVQSSHSNGFVGELQELIQSGKALIQPRTLPEATLAVS